MIPTLVLTVLLMSVAMLGLGIGVLVVGKCIRGHCGSHTVIDQQAGQARCGVCGRQRPSLPTHEESLPHA